MYLVHRCRSSNSREARNTNSEQRVRVAIPHPTWHQNLTVDDNPADAIEAQPESLVESFACSVQAVLHRAPPVRGLLITELTSARQTHRDLDPILARKTFPAHTHESPATRV